LDFTVELMASAVEAEETLTLTAAHLILRGTILEETCSWSLLANCGRSRRQKELYEPPKKEPSEPRPTQSENCNRYRRRPTSYSSVQLNLVPGNAEYLSVFTEISKACSDQIRLRQGSSPIMA
jgi:hypothetical protein